MTMNKKGLDAEIIFLITISLLVFSLVGNFVLGYLLYDKSNIDSNKTEEFIQVNSDLETCKIELQTTKDLLFQKETEEQITINTTYQEHLEKL